MATGPSQHAEDKSRPPAGSATAPRDDDGAPTVLPYASGPADARSHPIRWFAISLCVYAATVYGDQLRWWVIFRPTRPHHYVVQAQAWLDGRLDLDPNLKLPDLSPVDGRPYSCFSPGPTILLLVPVAILGDRIPDLLLHCLLAAGAVALMHHALWLIAKRTGMSLNADTLQWLTAFFALGTIIWVDIPYRGVWFMAHWFSLAALTAALCLSARGWHVGAGIAWAFAFASRAPCAGALPALLYFLWDDFRHAPTRWQGLKRAAGFAVGPALMVAFMAWLNDAQFGSPLDFGRGRMQVASVYADRLEKGVFGTAFLGDNLRAFFLDPPEWVDDPPYLISRHTGTGLFFSSPAFLCLFAAVRRNRMSGVFWLAAGLTLLPMLFYYGHESTRVGARYLLDLYPLLFVLMMLAVGSPIRWWAKLLIALDVGYTFCWLWYQSLRW